MKFSRASFYHVSIGTSLCYAAPTSEPIGYVPRQSGPLPHRPPGPWMHPPGPGPGPVPGPGPMMQQRPPPPPQGWQQPPRGQDVLVVRTGENNGSNIGPKDQAEGIANTEGRCYRVVVALIVQRI